MKKSFAIFTSFLLLTAFSFGQVNLKDTVRDENSDTRSASSGFAEEEFRRGVQSYYRGFFNESIMEFEKALSLQVIDNYCMEHINTMSHLR